MPLQPEPRSEESSLRSEANAGALSQEADTVQVAVFDPQEVRVAVAEHGRQLGVLLPLLKHGHEVVDLVHVHVAHVVAAD